MALVKPFRGILYNSEKVNIAEVIAPPYDVISPEEQETLHLKSPYNIIHIELGKDKKGDDEKSNKYTRAAQTLKKWQKEGILRRAQKPAFYLYQQEYYTESGKLKERMGLIALVKLTPYQEKVVLPHEKTMAKPKEDRLRLMKATQANVSPLFGLYRDVAGKIKSLLKAKCYSSLGCLFDFTDEARVRHTFWQVNEPAFLKKISQLMEQEKILLADGHHRYETALRYQKEMNEKGQLTEEAPWNYTMMTLVTSDRDLTISPVHRGLKLPAFDLQSFLEKLGQQFDVTQVDNLKTLLKQLNRLKSHRPFGLLTIDQTFLLIPKFVREIEESLDVPKPLKKIDLTLLHQIILEKILKITPEQIEEVVKFEKDAFKLEEKVKKGHFDLAFFLNPVTSEVIWDVAEAGLRMPQKSSYFYPKVFTGIVMNSIADW